MRMTRAAALLGAAMAACLMPLGNASAQEKKVRMQIAGAYPGTLSIIGQGQIYTTERI